VLFAYSLNEPERRNREDRREALLSGIIRGMKEENKAGDSV